MPYLQKCQARSSHNKTVGVGVCARVPVSFLASAVWLPCSLQPTFRGLANWLRCCFTGLPPGYLAACLPAPASWVLACPDPVGKCPRIHIIPTIIPISD